VIEPAKGLDAAVKEFDRKGAAAYVRSHEEQLQQLLSHFPLADWPRMTLEQYALGQEESDETFCRWMEFRSLDVGSIRGGSARKLIIYKHKDKLGWYYPREFHNEVEAWHALRSEFIQAFELARRGEWDDIDALPTLARGPALRLKTLHIYFPEDILPIFSAEHLRHFLQLVRPSDSDTSGYAVVRLNRSLLAALRATPGLADWKPKELERFLYGWADPKKTRRIVKIAPGENAQYWDDCRKGGYICVGWGNVGDLNDYESKEQFRDRFVQLNPYEGNSSASSKKANELWTLSELEPGDIVVANQGISKVLAVGEVVEPGYVWRDDRTELKHTVAVRWDTGYAQDIPAQKRWAFVTVAKVPDELFGLIIKKQPGPPPAAPTDPIYARIASSLQRKGQVILYGPPGTGKTYTARRFAVWWLMQQAKEAEADAVLGDVDLLAHHEKRLSTAQMTRRVWWIVANPKQWQWETLKKEGRVTYKYGRLKKNYALVQRGDWVIGYQATPDKKIVALARVSAELRSQDDGEPTIELEWVARVPNGLTYDELLDDAVLGKSEPLRFRCQGTLFGLTPAEANRLMALLSERNPDLPIAEGTDEGEVGRLTRVTFHPSYAYEDFVEGFRPSMEGEGSSLSLHLEDGIFKRVCRAALAAPQRPYLLLVDEINRGTVAKVLGELLTLVEKDKRGFTVTLPQSKETFSVPPNVYLLGTMNTADRSIKLLDAALRRRFSFIELMPDLALLRGAKVGDLALDDFLEELNRRIAKVEGREKQIGHSYFLEGSQAVTEPEQFASRFREEILPLLQEYCYDEFGALRKFIGPGLVNVDDEVLIQDKLDDPEQLIATLAAEFGTDGGEEA
jgi:5-methylcytosine-specific restriction protein B